MTVITLDMLRVTVPLRNICHGHLHLPSNYVKLNRLYLC